MRLIKKIFLGIVIFIAAIIIIPLLWTYCYFNLSKQYPIDIVREEINYQNPAEWVKSEKGDITIYGWGVEKSRDKSNTYLVSYTYANAEERKNFLVSGWWWEVNRKEKIARKVADDLDLEKRYGLKTAVGNKTGSEEKIKQEETIKNKWRTLRNGLTEFQVRSILGEPERIEAPTSLWVNWYYPNNGYVQFENNYMGAFLLSSWREPQWAD